MRERTKLSGGFFRIESSKGTGTVIRATWLIKQPSAYLFGVILAGMLPGDSLLLL